MFLALAFVPPPGLAPSFLESVGVVYELTAAALSMGVNGMPIFASCQFLHKDDWARVVPAIEAERKRRLELPL